MPSHNQADIQFFQELLTPEILGVIWISKDDLSEKEFPFSYFDYFFDGVISKRLEQTTEQGHSFFIGEHYGKPFYLGHIQDSSQSFEKSLKSIIQVINTNKASKNKILIYQEEGQSFPLSLKKQYKELDFSYFKLR